MSSDPKGKDVDLTGKRQQAAVADDVSQFLQAAANIPVREPGKRRGRLVFAMDATLSRAPTWDHAMAIQADMFSETAAIGGLDVQLIYFRGQGECRSSKWVSEGSGLLKLMTSVQVRGGLTQIGRILSHALAENARQKVDALIYIGDAVEENPDALCAKAGELGLSGVKTFVFHEGGDPLASQTLREIARLTGGAYMPFNLASAGQLKRLLTAVAVYAAGGRKALADLGKTGPSDIKLLASQVK